MFRSWPFSELNDRSSYDETLEYAAVTSFCPHCKQTPGCRICGIFLQTRGVFDSVWTWATSRHWGYGECDGEWLVGMRSLSAFIHEIVEEMQQLKRKSVFERADSLSGQCWSSPVQASRIMSRWVVSRNGHRFVRNLSRFSVDEDNVIEILWWDRHGCLYQNSQLIFSGRECQIVHEIFSEAEQHRIDAILCWEGQLEETLDKFVASFVEQDTRKGKAILFCRLFAWLHTEDQVQPTWTYRLKWLAAIFRQTNFGIWSYVDDVITCFEQSLSWVSDSDVVNDVVLRGMHLYVS